MRYCDGEQTLPLVALSAVQPHCVELRLSLGFHKTLPDPKTEILGWVSYLIIAWALNSSHKTVL